MSDVPVTGGPLPATLRALRSDSSFEMSASRTRTQLAKEWLEPLVIRAKVCALLGAHVKTDDEFKGLIDELYDGLRDRLTRQDLLMVLVDLVDDQVHGEAERMVLAAKAQIVALDGVRGFEKFIGTRRG